MAREDAATAVRLDKWLWAARFYKTRSAATEAVLGGKVDVNGDGAKPARTVRAGDTIVVRVAPYRFEVVVTGVGERRGTAAQAAELYQETQASAAARALLADQLRLAPSLEFSEGRPSKKDRRTIEKLRGRR
ncbi:MAG: RNA-binding S4 domain-containing protein [Gemmatimonadetes bacterium]|nr:RNA-binding S4 domain-containing protein [Gemmatimonadota bacterium]MBL0179323.1 RNA-binding S4 domain-containing protein [Gemmatimonadota bacterium]MBP9899412.1 RNA-binding S4 domain-containing protein [Gemmatimonadales bacterium]